MICCLAVGCTKAPRGAEAPGAAQPASAQASGPQLLLQPQLVRQQGEPTFNGTAFFLTTGKHALVVSSAHFITEKIDAFNFWSMQGKPLFQSRYSLWGFDEQGTDGAIQDLTLDLMVTAVPRVPAGFQVLEADPRKYIPPGERVWLPNKQESAAGHERVEGRIVEWDPGFVDVDLDRPIQFHSQSGSPVISVTSGKVVGVVSRVGGNSRMRLTPIWIAHQMLRMLVVGPKDQSRLSESGPADVGSSVPQGNAPRSIAPTFAWPDADWSLVTATSNKDDLSFAKQNIQVRKVESGAHVTSLTDSSSYYEFDLSADGSSLQNFQFAPTFRNRLRADAAPGVTDQDIDAYLRRLETEYSGAFGSFSVNWVGQTFRVGSDYERKIDVNLFGIPATLHETFRLTRTHRCMREKARRCVELKLRRQYGATEIARIHSELALRGDPLAAQEIPDVRYMASVSFEEQGMVPHTLVTWRTAYTSEPSVTWKLWYFAHPDPARERTKADSRKTADSGTTQPRLPNDEPIPALGVPVNAGVSLRELRAAARPLYMTGPGPEAAPVPPPPGAQEMLYTSGALQLRGWLAKPNAPGNAPIVVYLHDAFSPSPADWSAAGEFLKRGFAVFVPQLRGEAGNPGAFSLFFNEVDDVVAAGNACAGLPGVDPKRIYLVGRGNGGTLALLVAEQPSPFAAAAAITPVETTRLAFQYPLAMPFDTSDTRELALRDPLRFPGELRLKTLILTPNPAQPAAAFCTKVPSGGCSVSKLGESPAADAQAIVTAWQ